MVQIGIAVGLWEQPSNWAWLSIVPHAFLAAWYVNRIVL
jgi:hypothetical protein